MGLLDKTNNTESTTKAAKPVAKQNPLPKLSLLLKQQKQQNQQKRRR